jgi:hypothetical protein
MSQPELEQVLQGLAEVPWSRMTHCRGSAEDLPALLTTLLGAAEPALRKAARDRLWDAVQYQGSVFEPTAQVIPVLARGLALLGDQERGVLVAMLGNLCTACTLTEGQGLLHRVPPGHPDRPRIEAQFVREKGYVLETQRALWGAREVLVGLLDERDRMLRLQVPHALTGLYVDARAGAPAWANLPRQAAELSARLQALAAADDDPTTQAGLVFALGMLQDDCPENLTRLREGLSGTWQRPARVAAALALLGQGPEPLLADILIAALADREEHGRWFPHPFPWLQTHLRFLLIGHLCSPRYSEASFLQALPVLIDVLRRDASAYTLEHDALPVIARALGGRKVRPGQRRADLPEVVVTVLEALADNAAALDAACGNAAAALRPLGLPADRAGWQRLLQS